MSFAFIERAAIGQLLGNRSDVDGGGELDQRWSGVGGADELDDSADVGLAGLGRCDVVEQLQRGACPVGCSAGHCGDEAVPAVAGVGEDRHVAIGELEEPDQFDPAKRRLGDGGVAVGDRLFDGAFDIDG